MPAAASAARTADPRALAERVTSLARRLAERNRVLTEEVAELRAHLERINTPPHVTAAPGAATPHPPSTPEAGDGSASEAPAAPAAAPPQAPVRDRESEKLLELVRIALDRTLQEVDDHLDRIQGRDDLAPEDLDTETADHAR